MALEFAYKNVNCKIHLGEGVSICRANQNLFACICDCMTPVGNQPDFIVTPLDTCAALSSQCIVSWHFHVFARGYEGSFSKKMLTG